MRDKPWDASRPLPWGEIKQVWESHWDSDKPVLLEKSPPNLIRSGDIAAHFQPVKFVVMVRNPYAHAEGLMRRNNWKAQKAANFAAMCLRKQLDNRRQLDNTLVLTYESLVADPAKACRELVALQPELADMDHQASFEVHSVDGTFNRPITDLNARKIEALSPAAIETMNRIFTAHRETLDAWGYNLMEPQAAGEP